MSFADLPPELLLAISEYLPCSGSLRCVNKKSSAAIPPCDCWGCCDEDYALQRLIEDECEPKWESTQSVDVNNGEVSIGDEVHIDPDVIGSEYGDDDVYDRFETCPNTDEYFPDGIDSESYQDYVGISTRSYDNDTDKHANARDTKITGTVIDISNCTNGALHFNNGCVRPGWKDHFEVDLAEVQVEFDNGDTFWVLNADLRVGVCSYQSRKVQRYGEYREHVFRQQELFYLLGRFYIRTEQNLATHHVPFLPDCLASHLRLSL